MCWDQRPSAVGSFVAILFAANFLDDYPCPTTGRTILDSHLTRTLAIPTDVLAYVDCIRLRLISRIRPLRLIKRHTLRVLSAHGGAPIMARRQRRRLSSVAYEVGTIPCLVQSHSRRYGILPIRQHGRGNTCYESSSRSAQPSSPIAQFNGATTSQQSKSRYNICSLAGLTYR